MQRLKMITTPERDGFSFTCPLPRAVQLVSTLVTGAQVGLRVTLKFNGGRVPNVIAVQLAAPTWQAFTTRWLDDPVTTTRAVCTDLARQQPIIRALGLTPVVYRCVAHTKRLAAHMEEGGWREFV